MSAARAATMVANGDVRQLAAARLTPRSSIAALVPHFHCEAWLADCLASLVSQTCPLDAIVVIDDGSGAPPIDIVARCPSVTLLAAAVNVGPYRLIQQVIDDTNFDGYLFQDADDWSSSDRLEVLLAEADRTGAELVGCQEIVILCDRAEARPMGYPLDVNGYLRSHPGAFALVHHASVVSRDLVQRAGGFATGLRFGGDAEFLQRAACLGRVRNVPNYGYFRRQRAGSLTTEASTGLRSPERVKLSETLRTGAARDAAAMARGEPVCVSPCVTAGPVALAHILGPVLTGKTWDEADAADAAHHARIPSGVGG